MGIGSLNSQRQSLTPSWVVAVDDDTGEVQGSVRVLPEPVTTSTRVPRTGGASWIAICGGLVHTGMSADVAKVKTTLRRSLSAGYDTHGLQVPFAAGNPLEFLVVDTLKPTQLKTPKFRARLQSAVAFFYPHLVQV